MDINCSARTAAPRLDVTERAFQQKVVELAHIYSWRVAHFRPARVKDQNGGHERFVTAVAGDGKGFPDLVLINTRFKLMLYRELKTRSGRLSPDQEAWRDAIIAAGGDWDLWRPQHFDDVIIPTLTGTPRRTT